MDLRQFFKEVGGDYENVLQRLSSEQILLKYIRKFADEPSCSNLKAAAARGDVEAAFRAAHTLKGTAATLGFGELTRAASELTELLRGASSLPETTCFEAVYAAHLRTLEAISSLD